MKDQRLFALAPIGRPRGVDRKTNTIMGGCIAQVGVFREDAPRGSFDAASLGPIIKLVNAAPGGIKCHLGHASIVDYGVANFVGRWRDAYLDGQSVRANLTIDASAKQMPGKGDVASWLMTRLESDPSSMCASLVVGNVTIDDGDRSPAPAWRVGKITACDLVDEGAAVASLLSSRQSRMGRFVQRLDAMKVGANGAMPELTRRRLDHFDVSGKLKPITATGNEYLLLAHFPNRVTFPHDGQYKCFAVGAFGQRVNDQHVHLLFDYERFNVLGDNFAVGNVALDADDHGLFVRASLWDGVPQHAKIIDAIIAGEHLGVSIEFKADSFTANGVVYQHNVRLSEVSITPTPANGGALVCLTNVQPVHVREVASGLNRNDWGKVESARRLLRRWETYSTC